MPRGQLFTTDEPDLSAWSLELEACIARRFPEFFNDSASSLLTLRPDEFAGRGVALADGVRLRHETAVGLYFGAVRSWSPPGDYVLAMPAFSHNGARLRLSLDAGPYCRRANPSPINMTLFNHSCRDATVHTRRVTEGTISCAVAFAPAGLAGGSHLLWNYDGGLGCGGFTVGSSGLADLVDAGITAIPCRCRGAAPCPRSRFFPSGC